MSYNRNNLLKKYQKIIDTTTTYYDPVYFKYKSVWRKYINEQFNISYEHYMHIISNPEIMKELSEFKKEKREKSNN